MLFQMVCLRPMSELVQALNYLLNILELIITFVFILIGECNVQCRFAFIPT